MRKEGFPGSSCLPTLCPDGGRRIHCWNLHTGITPGRVLCLPADLRPFLPSWDWDWLCLMDYQHWKKERAAEKAFSIPLLPTSFFFPGNEKTCRLRDGLCHSRHETWEALANRFAFSEDFQGCYHGVRGQFSHYCWMGPAAWLPHTRLTIKVSAHPRPHGQDHSCTSSFPRASLSPGRRGETDATCIHAPLS